LQVISGHIEKSDLKKVFTSGFPQLEEALLNAMERYWGEKK